MVQILKTAILAIILILAIPQTIFAQAEVEFGGTGNNWFPPQALIVGNGSNALTSTTSPTVGYITATSGTSTLPQIRIVTAINFLGDYITNVATWFSGLFDTNLATKDTDDLAEGSNLYYTDGRVSDYISSSSSVPNFAGGTNEVMYWDGSNWNSTATSSWDTTLDGSLYLTVSNWLATTTHALISTLPSLNITESQISDLGAYLTALTPWTSNIDGAGYDLSNVGTTTTGILVAGDDTSNTATVNGNTISGRLVSWVDDGNANVVAEMGVGRAEDTSAISGSVLFGARSRGTLASKTVVQDGDNLFDIVSVGHDGTDYALSSRIDMEVDGTPGNNDMPGRIVFKTSPDGSQTPTERLRIASDGVVTVAGDIITGTKNLTSYANTFNGSFLEPLNATTSSDGSTISVHLENAVSSGSDLTMRFSTGDVTLTAPTSTTLTAGSDTAPQANYVYIPVDTQVLTVSTSNWPTTEHIKIAYIFAQSATFVAGANQGALVNQNWNDFAMNTNNRGETVLTRETMRYGTGYFSGVDGNGSDNFLDIVTNGGAPDEVYIKTTAGLTYQANAHTIPAKDTSNTDIIHVVNHNTTPYFAVQDIADLLTDASGGSLSGRYFNIIVGIVGNKTGEYTPLVLNLPTGSYSNLQDAVNDVDNYDVVSGPREFLKDSTTGLFIARITLKHSAAGGGTWTMENTSDLRLGSIGGGSAIATSPTTFADNQFAIFDETNLHELTFSLDNLTTNRLLNMPDYDVDLGLWRLNGSNIYNNAGNVGIGSSSPLAKLTVQDGAVLFNGTTGSTPMTGSSTRMMWIPEKGAFRAGAVTGIEWNDVNIGLNSAAFGLDNQSDGPYSFTSGEGNTASGENSVAMGGGNSVSSLNSIAIGRTNSVSVGEGNVGIGYNNSVSGTAGASAFGYQNNATGIIVSSLGSINTVAGINTAGIGVSNVISGNTITASAIGTGNTVSANNSSAIGFANNVSTGSSASIGAGNDVGGANSVAVGISNEIAVGADSVAIGAFLSNEGADSLTIGTGISSIFKLYNNSSDMYLGHGSTIPTMVLTNAGGTGKVGKVGIGTTSPMSDLSVVGTTTITNLISCDTIDTDASGTLVCGTDDGAGSGEANTVSTSSVPTVGNLAYWTSNGTPSLLSDVATGTLSETVTGLELSASRYLVGGSSVLALTSGYEIPLSASTTEWATAYGWGDHSVAGYSTGAHFSPTDIDTDYGTETVTSAWSFTTATTTVAKLDITGAIDIMGEYFTNFTTYVRSLFTGGNHITITAGSIAVDDDFLLNTGDTGTGAYDFGGSSGFEIPNGTAPTVNAEGEIAHDTTDDQLIIGAGADVIRTSEEIFKVKFASTSQMMVSGAVNDLPVLFDGYTVTDIACHVEGGTSKIITLYGETITCLTTVTQDDGTITSGTVTALATTSLTASTDSGAWDWLNLTIRGKWTRE